MCWRTLRHVKDTGQPQRTRPQRWESVERSVPSPGAELPLTQVSSPAGPKVGQSRWKQGAMPVCEAPEAGCTREAGCLREELPSPPGHRGKVAVRGLRHHWAATRPRGRVSERGARVYSSLPGQRGGVALRSTGSPPHTAGGAASRASGLRVSSAAEREVRCSVEPRRWGSLKGARVSGRPRMPGGLQGRKAPF